MPSLSQLPLTFLEAALVANPSATTFPWTVTDNGSTGSISRATVLTAFTTLAAASGYVFNNFIYSGPSGEPYPLTLATQVV